MKTPKDFNLPWVSPEHWVIIWGDTREEIEGIFTFPSNKDAFTYAKEWTLDHWQKTGVDEEGWMSHHASKAMQKIERAKTWEELEEAATHWGWGEDDARILDHSENEKEEQSG